MRLLPTFITRWFWPTAQNQAVLTPSVGAEVVQAAGDMASHSSTPGDMASHSSTPGNLASLILCQDSRSPSELIDTNGSTSIQSPELPLGEQKLEAEIHRYGQEIFQRINKGSKKSLLAFGSKMAEQMMAVAMNSDPEVQTRLFQLVDVYPSIMHSSKNVYTHIRQYLLNDPVIRGKIKGQLSFILGAAEYTSKLPLAGKYLVKKGFDKAVKGMASTFIAGSTVEEASKILLKKRNQGIGFVIDPLGEAVLSEEEAKHHCDNYMSLITELSKKAKDWTPVPILDESPNGPLPKVHIAIKPTSLSPALDPVNFRGSVEALKKKLKPIFRHARENDVFVWIDMEDRQKKDITLTAFKEILAEKEFSNWRHVGIAIQAYLKETERDIDQFIEWAKTREASVSVRLVKGAYWDYENANAAMNGWSVPVFNNKDETDANYEQMTRKLLDAYPYVETAVASHNVRSISHALAYAKEKKLPKNALEFEFLHGMANPTQEALVGLENESQRVRIYTPYGDLVLGMAYLIRRLLENTSQNGFMLQASQKLDDKTQEEFLQPPLTKIISSPSELKKKKGFSNEPLTDFAIPENRAAMQQALEKVRKSFGKKDQDYPIMIGGRKIVTEKWIESRNPSNPTELIGRVSLANESHVDLAVQAARDAFKDWNDKKDVKDRARILIKAANLMKERKFELAALIVYETGKTQKEADADVAEAIDFLNYYARKGVKNLSPKLLRSPLGEENVKLHEGRGVFGVIAPWNFPLAIMTGMTSAALVSGNTVVLKPAEQSVRVASEFVKILEEAGIPPGVCNYLPGYGEEVGAKLTEHPDVNGIVFTGSTEVGEKINEVIAKRNPRRKDFGQFICETGGKNAIIVDETADMDEALKGILQSAFSYGGQKCSAASRVIVVGKKTYNRLVERLANAVRDLKVGPADDPSTDVGPLISEEALKRVRHCIETGKREGRMIVGDLDVPNNGHYISPTIFADVKSNAKIAQEEIFGPVLSLMLANDLTEALKIANDTPYSLTGGIYSRTPETIKRVRKEFKVGNLYINRKITGAFVDRQPFGAFGKKSGKETKAGGEEYLEFFTLQRIITENTTRRGAAVRLIN